MRRKDIAKTAYFGASLLAVMILSGGPLWATAIAAVNLYAACRVAGDVDIPE